MSQFRDVGIDFYDNEAQAPLRLKGLSRRTASVTPAAALAAASSAETAVTLRGVAVGDHITANAPASLETGLAFSGIRISAADTVQVRFTNVTAAAITGIARTWEFLISDLT